MSVLTILIVGSCEREIGIDSPENDKLSSELMSIKNKFQKQYQERGTTRSTENDFRELFHQLSPVWEYSFSEENEKEQIVLVPIKARLMNINVNYECAEKYRQTEDERYLSPYTLLCFKTNKQTKQEDFFFMSFVPSVDYLEKHDFDLSQNKYFTRDTDYDGKVLYHDLNSNFVNGWEYKQGKIVNYQYPKSQIATRGAGTEEITCYETWRVEITEHYYSVNGGPKHYNYTRYHTTRDEFCVFSTGGGLQHEVWWIEDDGNGGGGGGGYTPAPPPADKKPCAKHLKMTFEKRL